MDDTQKKSLDMADEAFELTDDELDSIAGGYIYHDKGDAKAHRREAFYVLDDDGEVVMRLDSMERAMHWADNLRTSAKVLTPEEFAQMRKKHH